MSSDDTGEWDPGWKRIALIQIAEEVEWFFNHDLEERLREWIAAFNTDQAAEVDRAEVVEATRRLLERTDEFAELVEHHAGKLDLDVEEVYP